MLYAHQGVFQTSCWVNSFNTHTWQFQFHFPCPSELASCRSTVYQILSFFYRQHSVTIGKRNMGLNTAEYPFKVKGGFPWQALQWGWIRLIFPSLPFTVTVSAQALSRASFETLSISRLVSVRHFNSPTDKLFHLWSIKTFLLNSLKLTEILPSCILSVCGVVWFVWLQQ